MIEVLYNAKRKRIDEYRYCANRGGELGNPESYEIPIDLDSNKFTDRIIEIVFVDGVFSHVSYPFRGQYGRWEWRILGGIAKEIDRLEEMYATDEGGLNHD